MTYLERYQNRVNADGQSVGESLKNNTLNFIDKKFKDAPTYRLAKVYKNNDFTNYSEIDTRVLEINRMGSLRTILLRPSKNLDIGNTLFFDGNYWLVYDKYGSVEDNVKLTVSKINSNLKWIDANDKVCTVPCVSSSSYLGSKSRVHSNNIDYNMFDVRLPTGQIMVFAEINKETKKIDLNHRFIFGRRVYEVIGIDDVSISPRDLSMALSDVNFLVSTLIDYAGIECAWYPELRFAAGVSIGIFDVNSGDGH